MISIDVEACADKICDSGKERFRFLMSQKRRRKT